MIWKYFFLDGHMVRHTGDQIGFWSVIHKNIFTWSIVQFRGQKICGLEDWWDLQIEGCSEVLKPWMLAHFHQDVQSEV